MEFSCESLYILGPEQLVALQCNRLHRASRAGFGRCFLVTQILVLKDLPLAIGGP